MCLCVDSHLLSRWKCLSGSLEADCISSDLLSSLSLQVLHFLSRGIKHALIQKSITAPICLQNRIFFVVPWSQRVIIVRHDCSSLFICIMQRVTETCAYKIVAALQLFAQLIAVDNERRSSLLQSTYNVLNFSRKLEMYV